MSDLSRPRWSVPLRPLISAGIIGLGLLALFWLAGCRPTSPPVVTPPGVPRWSLDVQVSDADGGVADAQVEIVDGPNKGIKGRTDASGRLLIPNLVQSGFTACASRGDEYQVGCAGVTLTSSQNVTLPLFRKLAVRPGQVVLCGAHGLCDGAGRHYFGGVTMFPAAWAYSNNRAWLDQAFVDLKPGAHDFARILGQITGPDPYWANRHNDLTKPGMVEAFGQTIDYLAARGGLRAWVVVFGDVSYTPAVRSKIVNDLIPVLKARQSLVLLVEVVNEALQLKPTPFPLAEAQGYAQRLKAALPGTVVIVSSPASETCADLRAVSTGDAIAPHFSRSTSGTKGLWTPSTQPWMGDTQPRFCGGRVTLDGEEIGIGSSVNSDNDPTRLATTRGVGGSGALAGDVLHSTPAGVLAQVSYHAQAGFMEAQESVRQMRALLNTKPDLQDWSHGSANDGPWTVHDRPIDSQGIKGTIDRFYCAWRGADSWCTGVNVRSPTTLIAKSPMHVSVHPAKTALTEILSRDVNAGESIMLQPSTPGVVVIGSPK